MRKTKQVTVYPYPKEWLGPNTQASMVSPNYSHVDGQVWSNNQETREHYRLNVATGQVRQRRQGHRRGGSFISAYGMPTDHNNNLYLLEFGGTSIGMRDAKTGEVKIYRTPFANSKPRRGRVDEQNRLWFAEYHGGIAMFDPKTETIKEWMTPTTWDNPYDVVPDQERRSLDRLDAHRPGDAAVPGLRRHGAVPAAAHHQHPPRVRRRDRPAAGALGRQQPRRVDRAGRAARLSEIFIENCDGRAHARPFSFSLFPVSLR